ncbi:MAG: hypothetical protein ACK4SW_04640, partial [Sulfurihydrogenibium azorense]
MQSNDYFHCMKPQEKIKRVFTIRVGGKERKRKVRTLLLDLAHFRNILTILIRKYYTLYKEHLL